jgi:hypothetical protein
MLGRRDQPGSHGLTQVASNLGKPAGPAATTEEALLHVLERCQTQGLVCRQAAKKWDRFYFLFGIPAAVLPAISGATSLAVETGRIAGASIALLASALAAAGGFLDSQRRSQNQDRQAVDLLSLADQTRLTLLDLKENRLDTNTARDELAKILNQQTALLRSDLDQRYVPKAPSPHS